MGLSKSIWVVLFVATLISTSYAYYTLGRRGTEDVVAVKISPLVSQHDTNFTSVKEKIEHLHGYVYLGPVGTLPHYHMFAKAKSHTPAHPHLSTHPLIESVHPQFPLERAKRAFTTPIDPLYSRQWHLHPLNSGGSVPHINVVPSWQAYGFGSRNITVGIIDDGLQSTHPDLASNYAASLSWDWMDNGNNPSPIAADTHGTSASGCVGAALNTACGVGVAPGIKISGLRIMKGDYGVSDSGEASALMYKCVDGNDIYTCSWGPYDDGKRLEGPGFLANAAIQQCIKEGRKGKGTIYVWAGGNGASSADSVNYDGYANRRETIAVGAITDHGTRGYYSETGAPLLIVTPSSGGTSGISTTSLHGGTECTNTFGGTSASSPIAAGAIALILSANPNLGWRDVQHILVKTATKKGIANTSSFTKNSAGYEHSMEYGFGILDTFEAVKLAKDWKNVPLDQVVTLRKTGGVNEALPIQQNKIKTITFDVAAERGFVIEHVEVHVKLTGSTRGKVDIYVKSPGGMESTLQENHGKDNNSVMDWSFWSVRHWGEAAEGVWSVRFVNNGIREGRLTGLDVNLFGYYTTTN